MFHTLTYLLYAVAQFLHLFAVLGPIWGIRTAICFHMMQCGSIFVILFFPWLDLGVRCDIAEKHILLFQFNSVLQ